MTTAAGIQPIPTTYGGVRFRSRLEARWAVFFDHLRIPWEYEPQGFDIGDGEAYLPDFILGMGDILWVEVKPSVWADPDGVARWEKFIRGQKRETRGALLTSMNGDSSQRFRVITALGDGDLAEVGVEEYQPAWSCCPDGYHFDLEMRGSTSLCRQCGETVPCSSCNGTGLHKGGPVVCYCCDPHGSGRVRSSGAPWDDDKRLSEAYSAALSARFGTG